MLVPSVYIYMYFSFSFSLSLFLVGDVFLGGGVATCAWPREYRLNHAL